jgi:hypothetical protein
VSVGASSSALEKEQQTAQDMEAMGIRRRLARPERSIDRSVGSVDGDRRARHGHGRLLD